MEYWQELTKRLKAALGDEYVLKTSRSRDVDWIIYRKEPEEPDKKVVISNKKKLVVESTAWCLEIELKVRKLFDEDSLYPLFRQADGAIEYYFNLN